MSDVTRRELLLSSLTLAALKGQDAAHVHHEVAQRSAGAPYQPKCFNPHEYDTLRLLADLIMPGAREAGAAEFIDFLSAANAELAAIYTGGLAWLDAEMQRRYQHHFLSAAPDERTALLDLIAYRKNDSPALGPGIRFFTWARNMTVDAYFTSPAGMKYLGYMGNTAVSHFSVPDEALQYALKRLGGGL